VKSFRQKIKEIAQKHNLPESIVKEMYDSQFRYIKETIEKIDFKEVNNREEFNKLKCNFQLKYLGKLYTRWGILKKRNKK